MSLRLGILRPGRTLEVVAAAEAAVIRHELTRRLGDVSFDLRIDGDRLGPWLPDAAAAWPGEIDIAVDTSPLWNEPLTALFGRTVDSRAAEVRQRMLRHLDVIPEASFVLDDARLAELLAVAIRPTDLWLIARAAADIAVDDPAITALAGSSPTERVDLVFDTTANEVAAQAEPFIGTSIARLTLERDDARREADAARDELARVTVEVADRLDALTAETAVLRDRLAKAELRPSVDR